MFRRSLSFSITTLIALSGVLIGQSQTSTKQDRTASPGTDRPVTLIVPNGVLTATVPPGDNAWVIQINMGGGFGSSVPETITITSAGNVTCGDAEGPNLSLAKLEELSQLVAVVNSASAVSSDSVHHPTSLCSDCTQTTLVLSRREAKQKTKTYSTSWDVVTRALLAEDLARLYESVSMPSLCRK